MYVFIDLLKIMAAEFVYRMDCAVQKKIDGIISSRKDYYEKGI